jgi:16S rRNA (guanine(527)-N(7))-methyltransferase RsmG
VDNSLKKPTSRGMGIRDAIAPLGWVPTDERSACLVRFIESVLEAPISIVSRGDRERLVARHLIPSLGALPFLPEHGKVLDIGSGGGFPAIPLAIARPDLEFVLVDSTRKKVDFLNETIRSISLTNATVMWVRAEELVEDPNFVGSFQTVTARAVAKLRELLPVIKKLLVPEGEAILWKGRNWRREGQLQRFGFVLEQELPLSDGSVLLVLSQGENERPRHA